MYKLLVLALFFVSQSAFAATVSNVRYDSSKEYILVDVNYGGGCKNHKFELQVGSCRETNPVSCDAKLVDLTVGDACEAFVHSTAVISMKKAGLTERYYANGSVTITGDKDSSGKESKVTIYVPQQEEAPAPVASATQVACTTHTGSKLNINEGTRKVSLKPTSGLRREYKITKISRMLLESYPPVHRTTYKLDDGRSVVTSFRGEKTSGTGNYIRLSGKYSPNFNCKLNKATAE